MWVGIFLYLSAWVVAWIFSQIWKISVETSGVLFESKWSKYLSLFDTLQLASIFSSSNFKSLSEIKRQLNNDWKKQESHHK